MSDNHVPGRARRLGPAAGLVRHKGDGAIARWEGPADLYLLTPALCGYTTVVVAGFDLSGGASERTIIGMTRAASSKGGNPRYTVNTSDGTWKTVQDGQVGHSIANSEYSGEVILTIDKNEIVGVSTVDGEHCTGRQK